ncbi:cell division protein FtsA, partial [Clostridium perfringens]
HNAIRNVRVRNTGGSNNSSGISKKPVHRAKQQNPVAATQEPSQKPGFIDRLKKMFSEVI